MIIYVKQTFPYPPPSVGLPSGYTQLDFVSTDVGCFYLDINLLNTSVCVLDAQVLVDPGSGDNGSVFLFESSFGYLKRGFLMDADGDGIAAFTRGSIDTSPDLGSTIDLARHSFILSERGYSADGVPSQGSSSVFLMANRKDVQNGGQRYTLTSFKTRVYGFSVFDVNGFCNYLTPCSNSEGHQGLYDLAGGVFYPYLSPNRLYFSFHYSYYKTVSVRADYPVLEDVSISVDCSAGSNTWVHLITLPKGSTSATSSTERYSTSRVYVDRVTCTPRSDSQYFYTYSW